MKCIASRHGRRSHPAASLSRVVAAAMLLVALLGTQAHAQVISLSDAYRRMLDRELQYQILDLEQDVAAELVQQARGQRLPRVGLSIRYIYTDQEIISQDNATFQRGKSTYPTANMTFSVTQPIYDAVRWRAFPVARAESELIAARAEAARNELSSLLINAYPSHRFCA
jgi:outer membrane protein